MSLLNTVSVEFRYQTPALILDFHLSYLQTKLDEMRNRNKRQVFTNIQQKPCKKVGSLNKYRTEYSLHCGASSNENQISFSKLYDLSVCS